MKIVIHWQPELPGFRSSTRDKDGLRDLFGEAETNRILAALAAANGAPVTLTVNGRDAGFLDLDSVQAEFSVHDQNTVRLTRQE
jgi:hypothetical protein